MESALKYLLIDRGTYFDDSAMKIMKEQYDGDDNLNERSDLDKKIMEVLPLIEAGKIQNNPEYCLLYSKGAELWKDCGAEILLRREECAFFIFDIVSNGKPFDKFDCYCQYEAIYGFGSFYEDILLLAWDSPQFCVYICQVAANYMLDPSEHPDFGINCSSAACTKKREQSRFPISSQDWEILDNFDEKDEFYNTKLDKYNEYCLSCEKGFALWEKWICISGNDLLDLFSSKLKVRVLFEAVGDSHKFKGCCLLKYENEYGLGTIAEDLRSLAYDSPYWCLKICQTAYQYRCIQMVKQSLSENNVMIKSKQVTSIISSCLFGIDYIKFIEIENDRHVPYCFESGCKYCGDYVEQYENGSSIMDRYSLMSDDGHNIWKIAQVDDFIENCQEIAYRVVSHCKLFDKYKDYQQYEMENGKSSFIEDVHNLAFYSPYICLKLSEASIINYCFNTFVYLYDIDKFKSKRIISISLYELKQLKRSLSENNIPSELIEIIAIYLFEYNKEICNA